MRFDLQKGKGWAFQAAVQVTEQDSDEQGPSASKPERVRRELGISDLRKKEKESEVTQSCPISFATPWDRSLHQAPPSVDFSKHEYWSGLPFSPISDLRAPLLTNILPHSLNL